jgi:transposase
MKQEKSVNQKLRRRKYDDEFKRSAVEMVLMGRSIADVSSSLGISPGLLGKWKAAMNASKSGGEPSGELESLRRYIRQLEMERDILKKALSIFSRAT